MAPAERIFCASAPGMEPVLARELAALGLAARAVAGGVEAEGADAAAWACLASRVAESVLLRLWEGPARDVPAGKRAARRAAGARAELRVRAEGERATISVDAAGAPLFRRGWRARVGAAPLRESLAAGFLLACGFDGDRPFLDPMCGPIAVAIHASDRNAGALRLARKNAEAAGVADALRLSREDAARVAPPAGAGLCAVNPPWGVRLDAAAADAWRALGALFARLAGWEVAVLGPDRGYERLLPGPPLSATPIRNGGVACRLLRFRP
jgi:putative N6-adenine-specific DNA methylase